jgi:hypothetical protein
MKKKKLNLQGGFSEKVASHPLFQDYASVSFCGGYIGSSDRSNARDSFLEYALREYQDLGPGGIACWLTSTSARHMMDDVSKKTTLSDFKKRVIEYIQGAFLDVTIWSHPDHKGSLSSSIQLRERLKSELTTS